MTITLVVQQGQFPIRNANTFCSLEYADNFHQQRGRATWAAATEEVRKAALVNATDFVNNEFNWKGIRSYTEEHQTYPQFLEFPRDGLLDDRDFWLEGVPDAVQRSVAEMAYHMVSRNSTDAYPTQNTVLAPNGILKKFSSKTGPLSKSYEYASPAELKNTPTYFTVERWVQHLVKPRGKLYR